jgi:hypothetical protein
MSFLVGTIDETANDRRGMFQRTIPSCLRDGFAFLELTTGSMVASEFGDTRFEDLAGDKQLHSNHLIRT